VGAQEGGKGVGGGSEKLSPKSVHAFLMPSQFFPCLECLKIHWKKYSLRAQKTFGRDSPKMA